MPLEEKRKKNCRWLKREDSQNSLPIFVNVNSVDPTQVVATRLTLVEIL